MIEDERHNLDDPRCVWMSSKVISYRLCDKNFDCANCELDRVLRSSHNQGLTQAASSLPEHPQLENLGFEEVLCEASLLHRCDYGAIRVLYGLYAQMPYSPDVRYWHSHFWAWERKPGLWRIGLDGFAAQCMEKVDRVIYARGGSTIELGTPLCWLFFDDWNLNICSPVAGEVRAVNKLNLHQDPARINRDPFGRGWLLEIEPERSDFAPGRKFVDNLREWYRDCMLDVYYLLGERTVEPGLATRVGATMADGGEPVNSLRLALGRDEYIRLVKRVLSSK